MKNLYLPTLLLIAIVPVLAVGRTYTTTFPNTENPLSEGGNWVNGAQSPGLSWTNMRTTPGIAFGTQTGSSGHYDDSTALLTGTWGPDQTVTAVVHAAGNYGNQLEIEIRLRSAFGSHLCTGYEIDMASGYIVIVKWLGPLDSYTQLTNSGGNVVNGDKVTATITGTSSTVIKVYKNGGTSPILQVTDSSSPWTSGNPGMGWFTGNGGDSTKSDIGFSSYTATDGQTSSGQSPPSHGRILNMGFKTGERAPLRTLTSRSLRPQAEPLRRRLSGLDPIPNVLV